jgi:ABC-type nitrate/sulfonate/bicarbonate transport system substrate-binding protein
MTFSLSRRDVLAAFGGTVVALGAPQAMAAEKLRVGKAVAQVFSFVPLNIGMKYGFFQKEGLEIEENNFVSGSGLAQALTAGAIDITLSGGPDMAFTAKGAPEIAIASITSSPAFMGIAVGSQSTARSIDDLKGKKIAVTSAGSLTYWLADELNRVKGWTGDDRAIPVAIGGAPSTQFAAIKTGQVDASIGGLQVGYQLEEEHAGRLLVDLSAYVQDIELFVTFASTNLVQQNPDAARRFLRAWYEAVDFMKSHKAETVQLSVETAGYTPLVADRMYDRLMPLLSSDGNFEPKALEKLRTSFIDLKVLDSSVDISKLYTTEFLPKK